MNWIRSQGDGARGSASIPAGSTITGIKVGFEAYQTSGAQTGGTCVCGIFKGGALVASKSVSMPQGASVGPFGASNDLWGLGGVVSPTYFTDMYFGLHLNFPNITANINMYAWNGYMDIYYNDPTPTPTAISAGAGNNQSAVINTQFGLQMYAIVVDQGGNPMSGISVTFTLPASGASAGFNSLGGAKTATAVTNSSGGAVSPFFYANGTTGNWQPVADVTGSSPLIFVRFNMTNNPVPPALTPSSITILQGSGQQVPVSTNFPTLQVVQVRDQFSAPMNNIEITWPVPASGARGTYAGGTPAHTFTDVSGVATAPRLTANAVAGAWTESAFPTGFPAIVAPFSLTNLANNAPPQASGLQIISGNSQAAALSTNFPSAVIIKVTDQYGSAFPGASVQAVIPNSGNGSFLTGGGQSKTVTSDASGNANFGTIVAGAVASGGWNMTISCSGTPGTTVGAFRNVDASVATTLTAISGASQQASPSAAFAQPLVVRATNGLGNPIQNVSVTFTAPGTSASCRFSGNLTQVVLTDVSGNATSVTPVATSTVGAYTVVASASGLTSANFPLTNGITYLAEVCLPTLEIPGNAANFGTGAGTPSDWLLPANVLATGGNTTTYTTNVQQPPTSNRSKQLLCNPAPSSWAAIKDDALITKLFFQCWGRGLPNGGTLGDLLLSFIKNGSTHPNFSAVPYVGWGNGSFSLLGVSQFNPPTTGANIIVGADLKNSNTGYGLSIAPAAGTVPGGGFNINGAVMRVCYQDVDKSNLVVTIPLQMCIY
jgi:hypothetical protein